MNGVIQFLLKLFRLLTKVSGVKKDTIAVIATHNIGDSIFTIPAIKYLVQKFETSNFVIVCFPNNVLVFKSAFGDKIKLLVLDPKEYLLGGRFAPGHCRKMFKKLNPTKIYDTLGTIKSFSLFFTTRAEQIFGVSDKKFITYYDHAIYLGDYQHLIDGYLAAAGAEKNVDGSTKVFEIKSDRDNRVLINPFGGWKAKEWNFYKFVKLFKLLAPEYNVSFVFQKDQVAEDVLITFSDEGIAYIETETLDELFNLIYNCGAFIGNDTGPLYIANMLGSPTFTIYGPTNPSFSKPFGDKHEHIFKKIKCSPDPDKQYCYTFAGRKGCPAFECMNLLDVEVVFKKVKLFLKNNGVLSIDETNE